MVGHDVGDVMHIVQPETYCKWVRQSKRVVVLKRSGRPRIPMATVNLALHMAEENTRWGYRRILGEFKKILKDSGTHGALFPSAVPGRKPVRRGTDVTLLPGAV